MPLRGFNNSNKNEWNRLNELLELAFNAQKDNRFLALHKQKPIEDDWSRIYEYIPGSEDFELEVNEPLIVGHFGLHNQKMQYGKSVITNGGGRDVATHPIVRGKGIGSKVAQDCIKFMFEKKIDLSILFSGAGHFYEKNGWRGGMQIPSYTIKKKLLEKWLKKDELNKNQNNYNLEVDIMTNERTDIKKVAELYSSTNEGLYFSAFRNADYWERHFHANPGLIWQFIIVRKENDIIAYVRYKLNKIKEKSIRLEITESRISKKFVPGTEETNYIIKSVIDFIKKEAMEPNDSIDEIILNLSKQHLMIKHFKEISKEMGGLKKNMAFKLNIMSLIANPYSLFEHLEREIMDRIEKGWIPRGKFSIKFDKSGKFPGGIIINSELKSIQICTNYNEFKDASKLCEDTIEFEDITALNSVFCRFLPDEELEDEEDVADYGITVRGKGLEVLQGLFKDVEYSLYDLDHF